MSYLNSLSIFTTTSSLLGIPYEPYQLRPDRNILHLSAFQLTDSGVLTISDGVSSNREMLCWPGLSLIMSVNVVLGSAETFRIVKSGDDAMLC